MLLFLSDLHFTDETTAVNVNAEAFDLMTAFALDTIERRSVKEVHVILLGDILVVWHPPEAVRLTALGGGRLTAPAASFSVHLLLIDPALSWRGRRRHPEAVRRIPAHQGGTMSRRLKVLAGLVVASVAGTMAQAQQQYPGGMGDLAGGMTCRGRDSATTAQLRVIHELVMNHDRISRSVTNLPNGVSTLTESDDPRLAELIRDHVVIMEQRVRKGDDPGLPMESPALRTMFRDRNKIRTGIESTMRGIVVVQTSSDPAVVAALQQHAAEVSDMAARGMPAMRDAMMKHGGGMLEPGMCAEMRKPSSTTGHR